MSPDLCAYSVASRVLTLTSLALGLQGIWQSSEMVAVVLSGKRKDLDF